MSKVNKTDKMNVSKMSDEDLQDMFEEAYRDQVGKFNNIDEIECKASKDGEKVVVELTVSGMAGSPTMEEYQAGKVKKSGSVTISRDGKGSLTFKLSAEKKDVYVLNSTDYVVVYKSI